MTVKREDFVHLHVHSDYSTLDGACKIEDLVAAAKRSGHKALSLTDHGNMCGALHFYKECLKKKIKPIIGCEVYLHDGDVSIRDKEHKEFNHMTLHALNEQGYRNLMRLCSIGHTRGFYMKPRINYEYLDQFNEGIVCLSGCLKGPVSVPLVQDKYRQAFDTAGRLYDIFGDRLFMEVQSTPIEQQYIVNDGCMRISRMANVPLAATCDVHYINPEDSELQELKICIAHGKKLTMGETRIAHRGLYYRSTEEMYDLFRHMPQALTNTRRIADMVDFTFPTVENTGKYYLPKSDCPPDVSEDEYIERLCRRGLTQRYGNNYTDMHIDRMRMELDVIRKSGYVAYFLIVAEFINYAKNNGIPIGPGRGSAAGSIVSYLLGITDVDPLQYGLLFERFLNPDRVSMPDIDIDICEENRQRLIDYVKEKYGNDCVGQIVTYGTMKAKTCVRDVGRVLQVPLWKVNQACSKIGTESLAEFEKTPDYQQVVAPDEDLVRVFDYGKRMEGFVRHFGKHAAGVVISDESLLRRIPMIKVGEDLATQYAMNEVEEVGLLKMDFLGLRTLTVIAYAEKLISRRLGREYRVAEQPLDDRKTYDLISEGRTKGVFQMESKGFQEMLRLIKPDTFEEIAALVALYRPGPMGAGMIETFANRKFGRERTEYLHPSLEPILRETYGGILYQEQAMRIASDVAGFTMAQADILRKAMGKKKEDVMNDMKPLFIDGCQSKSHVPIPIAEQIWDQIAYFAAYGFNKCSWNARVYDADTGIPHLIQDLVAKKPEGFRTFAKDKDGKIVKRRVLDFMSSGDQVVYKITTGLGHEIHLTDTHPLFTMKGWKPVKDFAKGDFLAVARNLPLAGQTVWPDHEIYMLGGLISEGNTCHPSCLYVYNKQKVYLDFYENLALKFPNTNVRRSWYEGKASAEICYSSMTKRQNNKYTKGRGEAARSGVYEWAKGLGILNKTATQKNIPEQAFSLSDKCLRKLIAALWSGDGYVFSGESKTTNLPYYATSSKQLAMDVQYICLRIGIPTSIKTKSFKYRGTRRKGYTIHVVGRDACYRLLDLLKSYSVGRKEEIQRLEDYLNSTKPAMSRDVIPVGVWSKMRSAAQDCGYSLTNIRPYLAKLSYRRETVQAVAEASQDEYLSNLSSSDLFWDRIKKIEKMGTRPTFDLEIEDDHNFVADNIIIHNSHSVAYGLLGYWTAYLKTNHPVEYMASTMTSYCTKHDRMLEYIDEAKQMGITIYPPDIQNSELEFNVKDGDIYYGLRPIKALGEVACDKIIKGRAYAGKFRSIFHFREHCNLSAPIMEVLIKAGAFDRFEHRAKLLANLEMIQNSTKTKKPVDPNQMGLFEDMIDDRMEELDGERMIDAKPWSEDQIQRAELEALGFYLSSHPLETNAYWLNLATTTTIAGVQDVRVGQENAIGGILGAEIRTMKDRNGRPMGFCMLEDTTGKIDCTLFADAYVMHESKLNPGALLVFRGVRNDYKGRVSFVVEDVLTFEEARGKIDKEALKSALEDHRQRTPSTPKVARKEPAQPVVEPKAPDRRECGMSRLVKDFKEKMHERQDEPVEDAQERPDETTPDRSTVKTEIKTRTQVVDEMGEPTSLSWDALKKRVRDVYDKDRERFVVNFELSTEWTTPALIDEIRDICERHPGPDLLRYRFKEYRDDVFQAAKGISAGREFEDELQNLLGTHSRVRVFKLKDVEGDDND